MASALRGRGPLVVGFVTGVACLAISLLRYLTYHTGYDLAFFDQVAEQTVRGDWFASSFVPFSFLGQHWEPILGLFAQLNRITPTPIWLLGIQAIALGLAPIGAARLARIWLAAAPKAPLIAALVMALSPLLTNGAAYDYHTEALTPAVALFALEAGATGRRLRFALLLLLLATIKEDAILVAAGVGWVAWRADGQRFGAWAAAGALIGFVVVTAAIMPFYRDGATSDLAERYAWLANGSGSIPAMLVGAATHPVTVLQHLVAGNALGGWAAALLPLALLPLLSGWAGLGALPPLLLALLSSNWWQSTLELQYGLEAAPLLVACALLAWRRSEQRPRLARFVPWALLIGAGFGYLVASPFPGGLRFDVGSVRGLDRHAAVEALLRTVPADARVSTTTGLLAHLSNRDGIWEFPVGGGTNYVVLDSTGQVRPDLLRAINEGQQGLSGQGFHVVASDDDVTIWSSNS